MAYFPFFVEIKNRNCLIVGGGIVAARKAETLLNFGCNITVVSPNFCEEIKQLDNINLIKRDLKFSDLESSFFVIAATNNTGVNSEIGAFCRRKNILVNVVDVKDECSFIFPSIYKNGDIVAGVTTSGKSPQIASIVRKTISENVPEYYGDIVERLGAIRASIKHTISTQEERKNILSLVLKEMLLTENKISDDELEKIIRG
ncbi:MAG TPA: siroheme synthase [Lachnospiraceae bacterium]|nr:siroheme synthase [Lachnospiraceae bacterium]